MLSTNPFLPSGFGREAACTEVVIHRVAQMVAEDMRTAVCEVERKGWLMRLDKRVLIVPALALPASPSARVTTSPDFLQALIHELRVRKTGLEIGLVLCDIPGWSGDEAMAYSGLREVVTRERLETVNVSRVSRFWWGARDIPELLPIPEYVVDGSFVVSLATLATHPVERLAGVLFHHLACLPGAWEEELATYRSRMMAWAAQLLPSDLCLVDGRFVADFSTFEGSRVLRGGVIVLAKSPIAVDTVAARVIGIEPRTVPALVRAYKATGLRLNKCIAVGECTAIGQVSKPGVPYYDHRTEAVIEYLPYPLRRRLLPRLVRPSQAAYAVRALWRIADRHWPGLGL